MTHDISAPPERAALIRYGWNDELEKALEPYAGDGLVPARVTAEHRGAYELATEAGEVTGELAGRLRHDAGSQAELPAVGDWVLARPRPAESRASVHAVLPRRTKFSRKTPLLASEEQVVAANVDVVFLVSALTRDLNPRRIERYLVLAWESGADPVVVLNKSDLSADVAADVRRVEDVALGVPIHVTSTLAGRGLDELERYFAGNRTVALLGSSGVGKSTLVNRLVGSDVQTTKEIRADGRGRHATTHRQLIPLPSGGLVLDTPGMRELQLWEAPEGIDGTFDDIARLAESCRFRDCRHRNEPGCAVLAALADGTLAPDRLESHRALERELAHLERKRDQRAAAEERKRWRAITKEQRARKKPR